MQEVGYDLLNPVMNRLGPGFTYEELRVVRASFIRAALP